MSSSPASHPQSKRSIEIIQTFFTPKQSGDPAYTTIFFKHESNYYQVDSSLSWKRLDESDLMSLSPVLIPEEHIFPLYVSDFITTAAVDDNVHYVKVPYLIIYDPNKPYKIATGFLREVQIMEALSRSPHPNIVKYEGCVVERRRIRGICMEQCVETLHERMETRKKAIATERVLESLRNAAMHIHDLGYCHNDISPWNIMFRNDGSVVIIDFDSCHAVGEELSTKRGSPGFYDKTATISTPANDFYSIARIEEYLATGDLPNERIYDDVR